ncbi:MAG: phosphotransferase [Desulfobacterales bacterium]|nr:phosphotransferase [Desulfobacterales bacterium]MDD4391736.1 phosphotransferase [Desulfobacterales bacterium]
MKLLYEALLDKRAYPHVVSEVRMVQTHISWVYITDTLVYKVKKPVDFGFLDFTSLAKRKYYCDQEIRLNRRLSPHVYLDVIPVTNEGGYVAFGGRGDIVDYAVKMNYIPEQAALRRFLDRTDIIPDVMDRVAKKIAAFHSLAETSAAIDAFGSIDTIKHNTDENFEQTVPYIGKSIRREQWNSIKVYTDTYFTEKSALFEGRVARHRIRDCHGDLHLDHVYVMDPVTIVDCIEFNERFRYSDVAADIAFLAMDLDFNGYPDLAQTLMASYVRYSGDQDVSDLLNFYKVYRACVRGKVISFKLDDPNISEEEKKRSAQLAGRYFALAQQYADSEKL